MAGKAEFVGTLVDARRRRAPHWAASCKASNRRRLNRQPGAFEEALAQKSPEPVVLRRAARSSAGYALLRAAGWEGHSAASEVCAVKARAPFALAELAASVKRPSSSGGAGYVGVQRVMPSVESRPRNNAFEVYDDGNIGDADDGLDGAAARMQVALRAQRGAAAAAISALEHPLEAVTSRDAGHPLAEFEAPTAFRACSVGCQVLLNGELVSVETACTHIRVRKDGPSQLPEGVAAQLAESAERERARLERIGLLVEGAQRKAKQRRTEALERTRELSSEIMKDMFVSSNSAKETKKRGKVTAKRPRKVDDVRRTVAQWAPESNLCKLFDVLVPPHPIVKHRKKSVLSLPPELDEVRKIEVFHDENGLDDGFAINAVVVTGSPPSEAGCKNSIAEGMETRNPAADQEERKNVSLPVLKVIFELNGKQGECKPRSAVLDDEHPWIQAASSADENDNGASKSTERRFAFSGPNTIGQNPLINAGTTASCEGYPSAVEKQRKKRRRTSRFTDVEKVHIFDENDGDDLRVKRKVLRAVDFF